MSLRWKRPYGVFVFSPLLEDCPWKTLESPSVVLNGSSESVIEGFPHSARFSKQKSLIKFCKTKNKKINKQIYSNSGNLLASYC